MVESEEEETDSLWPLAAFFVSALVTLRDRPRPTLVSPDSEVGFEVNACEREPLTLSPPHKRLLFPCIFCGPSSERVGFLRFVFLRSMMEGYVNELERKLDGDLIDALDSSIEEKIESNHREKKR